MSNAENTILKAILGSKNPDKSEIISRILTTLLESDDIDTAILTLSAIVERVSKEAMTSEYKKEA